MLLCVSLFLQANKKNMQQCSDFDRDGFPDVLELTAEQDRSSFRRWFTAIAQSQFYHLHPQWPKIRRDCAGLICFAYKEALKSHSKQWFKGYKYLPESAIPDVKAYRYPKLPLVQTNLFHSRLKGKFEPVATASVLMRYNCRYLGKELDQTVEPGDLLFFKYNKTGVLEDLFHALILAHKETNRADGTVVYHTGPNEKDAGEMRRLRISHLNKHPDDTWHVKPSNAKFMGFYRFHILDHHAPSFKGKQYD